jgi:F-type H+-transporting ATPase subunit a
LIIREENNYFWKVYISKYMDSLNHCSGEKGKQYIYYLMAVAIYIGVANIFGIFGFKPPTKDLGVTAALAILSILLIEISGIRARGGKGMGKKFC